MLAVGFGSLERPRLSAGLSQELAEQRATWAATGERAYPRPVTWRLQGLSDACSQVLHADAAQAANGWQVPAYRLFVQAQQRRDEDRVHIVRLGPRQHVVRYGIRETGVDASQGSERIDDDGLVDYRGSPHHCWVGRACRVARQQRQQGGSGGSQVQRATVGCSCSCGTGEQVGACAEHLWRIGGNDPLEQFCRPLW